MKKTPLLHSELSYLVATLGHTDEITICDAGLPVPSSVERIDLALTHGIPSFIQTVEVLLKESQIEGVIIANEFKQVSAQHHQALLQCLKIEELETGKTLSITYLPHEDFKLRTHQSKAIIRTGECTPYANVIFQTGVTF
ncbi:Ribose ABC transport system, high affinity permease RbsD (TC 3.A.1.2.1) [Vibrio casei]|uniref:D-ribose pyranase n=2 Tax=Vibrio casei TaxID=673372 RepID=A0A368LHQ2_9VIBR|nr:MULTISPECIES: D-ribose pyranase [Vibrio]RCS70274.1 D-ribose pyranase [Vibrio casei]SJN19569.1 Ribose ABC transport system, high affinity permease RbsD (TC 3.A.1.2.1) [Vibrio casei]HBV77743.1 D-ribose pyranase [Vibrio sp.]